MTNNRKIAFSVIVTSLSIVAIFFICDYLHLLIDSNKRKNTALQHDYDVYGGMTDELRDSALFDDMQSGKTFCFLGDSITNGTVTYGLHWYQPLLKYIKGDVTSLSYKGWEVKNLIDNRDIIVKTDVYVIAIGINDALTIGEKSITASKFADRCSFLANRIRNINPDADIYFIAPWYYFGFDDERMQRGDEFRHALGEMCAQYNYNYINPNPFIEKEFEKEDISKFMLNNFHPKAPDGIELFSYAVLKSAHEQRASNT